MSHQVDEITPDRVIARSPTALWRESLDGIVLLVEDDQPIWLAGPADIVWTLLDSPMTVERLVTMLESRFESAEHVVGIDTVRFIGDLAALGAVVLS